MVVVGGPCARHRAEPGAASQAAEFCAIMSDSVGLYVGNPVTQMGYKIGTVDNINARDTSVEVRFKISEHRPIPVDVKAVIRSTSILADRSLELGGKLRLGSATGGPGTASLWGTPSRR